MAINLSDIELLLLDVDGVLTDGAITYTDSGEQIKSFNAKDGLGIRLLMESGVEVGLITARVAGALGHRCKNLGITLIFEGVKDKASAFEAVVNTTGIRAEHIAFMGDDLIDLPAMTRAGIGIAVADAANEVKAHADLVMDYNGGKGAVRQACEAILKAKGLWEETVSRFLS